MKRSTFVLAALVAFVACDDGGPVAPYTPPAEKPEDPTSTPVWAPELLPALNWLDQLEVLPSDSLPLVGKVSEALAKAGISGSLVPASQLAPGRGGEFDVASKTVLIIREVYEGKSPEGKALMVVHEVMHALLGQNADPAWGWHTCDVPQKVVAGCPTDPVLRQFHDASWGDGGAWTPIASFARAFVLRVGDNSQGQVKAFISLIAEFIHADRPKWVDDPWNALNLGGGG